MFVMSLLCVMVNILKDSGPLRSLPGEFHNNGNLDRDGTEDFLLSWWLSELLKEYFILIHVVSVLFLLPQETWKQIHHVFGGLAL